LSGVRGSKSSHSTTPSSFTTRSAQFSARRVMSVRRIWPQSIESSRNSGGTHRPSQICRKPQDTQFRRSWPIQPGIEAELTLRRAECETVEGICGSQRSHAGADPRKSFFPPQVTVASSPTVFTVAQTREHPLSSWKYLAHPQMWPVLFPSASAKRIRSGGHSPLSTVDSSYPSQHSSSSAVVLISSTPPSFFKHL
jgi:hypothetical protein